MIWYVVLILVVLLFAKGLRWWNSVWKMSAEEVDKWERGALDGLKKRMLK